MSPELSGCTFEVLLSDATRPGRIEHRLTICSGVTILFSEVKQNICRHDEKVQHYRKWIAESIGMFNAVNTPVSISSPMHFLRQCTCKACAYINRQRELDLPSRLWEFYLAESTHNSSGTLKREWARVRNGLNSEGSMSNFYDNYKMWFRIL